MKREHNVAAVVVLYNPKDEALDRIASFANQVRHIYVIDNSTIYNGRVVDALVGNGCVTYINNQGNHGIAHALNCGADMALLDGFRFLLTMDQDTDLQDQFVIRLMQVFAAAERHNIGLAAPRYLPGDARTDEYEEVLITMTSGNILNLDVYKTVGPFMNELFIDHVDHEYCLRLKKYGFKVIQANSVELAHRPGTIVQVNFLGRKILFSSHSPVRLYYFCRNGLYVSKMYKHLFPEFGRAFRKLLGKELLKVPFERDKANRMRNLFQGYSDFIKGKLGPL